MHKNKPPFSFYATLQMTEIKLVQRQTDFFEKYAQLLMVLHIKPTDLPSKANILTPNTSLIVAVRLPTADNDCQTVDFLGNNRKNPVVQI